MVEFNKEGWKGLPGLTFGILTSGLILLTIGMAAPYWNWISLPNTGTSIYFGLWQECGCVSQTCKCGYPVEIPLPADWLKACQAMVVLGWVALLAACICGFIATFINDVSINKSRQGVAQIVLCFIAAGFILIGVAVWGSKSSQYLHWTFGITVVAMVFSVIGGALSAILKGRGDTNNY